jgi:hypothetical protein
VDEPDPPDLVQALRLGRERCEQRPKREAENEPDQPHGHLGWDGWLESSRRCPVAGAARAGQSSSAHRLIEAPHVYAIQTRSPSRPLSRSPQRRCSCKKAARSASRDLFTSPWPARVHGVGEAELRGVRTSRGVPRTQLANPRKQRACLASATPAYKGSTPSDFEEFPSSLEITSRSTLPPICAV